MSENEIYAQAVRTFEGEEGFKSPASEPFPVSRQRFADLKANGLVEEAEAKAEKAAPSPANKMVAAAKNK